MLEGGGHFCGYNNFATTILGSEILGDNSFKFLGVIILLGQQCSRVNTFVEQWIYINLNGVQKRKWESEDPLWRTLYSCLQHIVLSLSHRRLFSISSNQDLIQYLPILDSVLKLNWFVPYTLLVLYIHLYSFLLLQDHSTFQLSSNL